MKLPRIISTVLILGSISILASSCAPKQNSTTTSEQIVTVQRGNLSIDITAVGNLALSQKQDLAFEIPGTVEGVLVKEGDSVKEGQVLARLDTTEWDTQITTNERATTTAERKVTTAQNKLRDDQIAVTTAQNTVTSNEFALRQAELDYQTANETLNDITEVKKIQDEIDNANYALKLAQNMMTSQVGGGASIDSSYWTQMRANAQAALTQANKDMKDLLGGTNPDTSREVVLNLAKKQLAIEKAQLAVTQGQLTLQKSKNTLADAQNTISLDQEDIQNAQDDLKTAQKNLNDARKNSPEVQAPFTGFITSVNVEGGDEVKKGTVAVTIADPNRFEATLLVSETDITKVTLGGTASVELQAVAGTTLSANVTHIAPTATIQSGVVNYKVTVELQSPLTVTQAQQQGTSQVTTGNVSSGMPFPSGRQASISENLTQIPGGQFRDRPGFGSVNMTEEQRTQIMQQIQQTLTGQAGMQPQTTTSAASMASTTSTATVKLAEGMTATVTIPINSRTNVILVRNRAISRSGAQTTVKVIKDGVTESRTITTGLSNGTNTEVISGLSEGEQVVITQTTTTTTQQGGQGGMIIPGL